jgi:hypothetical protein
MNKQKCVTKIRSTKLEIRNNFKILNSNALNVLNFGHSIFGFVSRFDIRISNFSTNNLESQLKSKNQI